MQYVFFGCRKAPDVSTNREGLGGLKIPNVPHMPEGIHVAGESATLRGSPLHFPLHNSSQPLPAVQRALPTFHIVDGLSASVSTPVCLSYFPAPFPALWPLSDPPPLNHRLVRHKHWRQRGSRRCRASSVRAGSTSASIHIGHPAPGTLKGQTCDEIHESRPFRRGNQGWPPRTWARIIQQGNVNWTFLDAVPAGRVPRTAVPGSPLNSRLHCQGLRGAHTGGCLQDKAGSAVLEEQPPEA